MGKQSYRAFALLDPDGNIMPGIFPTKKMLTALVEMALPNSNRYRVVPCIVTIDQKYFVAHDEPLTHTNTHGEG